MSEPELSSSIATPDNFQQILLRLNLPLEQRMKFTSLLDGTRIIADSQVYENSLRALGSFDSQVALAAIEALRNIHTNGNKPPEALAQITDTLVQLSTTLYRNRAFIMGRPDDVVQTSIKLPFQLNREAKQREAELRIALTKKGLLPHPQPPYLNLKSSLSRLFQ